MGTTVDYRSLVGSNPDKMFKATIFESPRILLGLNCLEPGQSDRIHSHPDQDKFYYVIEGVGQFTMGEETVTASAGETVPVPAGLTHGVSNEGASRLVILMGLTPWPGP